MLETKKKIKFKLLKLKTTSAITQYKSSLTGLNPNVQSFSGRKALQLKAIISNNTQYVIFLNIFFYLSDTAIESFLANLRKTNVNYFFINQAELQQFSMTEGSFLFSPVKQGTNNLLLVITTLEETIYRNLLLDIFNLESSSANSAFNQCQLMYTKEQKYVVAFSPLNTEIRKLYARSNTKNSILLETLSLLQQSTCNIASMLTDPVGSIDVAPTCNFFDKFPFKS